MEKYEFTHYKWSLFESLIPLKTSCGAARRDPHQLFNTIF